MMYLEFVVQVWQDWDRGVVVEFVEQSSEFKEYVGLFCIVVKNFGLLILIEQYYVEIYGVVFEVL